MLEVALLVGFVKYSLDFLFYSAFQEVGECMSVVGERNEAAVLGQLVAEHRLEDVFSIVRAVTFGRIWQVREHEEV